MLNKSGKIGIFDSGIGGVTVLKEILKILPCENYIYYSDSKNNPYGDRCEKEIIEICDNIVRFLLQNNCKAIVIACNTASAKAAEYLRKKYKKIPIIAIEPAYKMVYDFAYTNPTLVMATKATIESKKFNNLYSMYNNHNTYLLSCVGLAEIIEEGDNEKINEYLKNKIGLYKNKVKNVVLGCTHYPLIKEQIQNILGEVYFFEGSKNVAHHLKNVLIDNNLINENMKDIHSYKIEFYDSKQSKTKKKRFFELINN